MQRAGHQPAPCEWLADPVAEAAGLCDAAPDIGKRQTADQRIVGLAKEEEGIGRVGALVLGVAAQPPSEGRAGQIVRRPCRLPRGEERATCLAQRRPLAVIGHLRRAQVNAIAFDDRQRLGKAEGAEEGHAMVQAAGRPRLSAIAAALSSPRPGPSTATAGRLRPISALPAARALSTVTASILPTISSR